MAIRPVDLQLLVQRTTETSRAEHDTTRRPEVAHQQFSQVMQKQSDEETHQVMQSNKSEQDGIDKNSSGNNKYEKRKKNKNKSDEKAKSVKQESTSMFDVTI